MKCILISEKISKSKIYVWMMPLKSFGEKSEIMVRDDFIEEFSNFVFCLYEFLRITKMGRSTSVPRLGVDDW